MKAKELLKWMEDNHKTATQVAGETGANVRTIERFLAEEHDPSPMLVALLKKLVEKK